MLEGPEGNDDGVDLRSLETQANQPLDDWWREPPFNNSKHLGFSCWGPHTEPFTNLDVSCIHPCVLLPTLCHCLFGKVLSGGVSFAKIRNECNSLLRWFWRTPA